jgi:hypothetical protein
MRQLFDDEYIEDELDWKSHFDLSYIPYAERKSRNFLATAFARVSSSE